MMKDVCNSEKGINLISLTVSVIIILILTSITIYNVRNNLGVHNLKNMQTDIGILRDKISSYYAQYGTIPASKKYSNIENIDVISGAVDTAEEFYVIDLEAMENITLSYGMDYEKIKNEEAGTDEQVNELKDLYIINKVSHNIFYVKGIELDGEIFYTDYTKENIDKVSLEPVEITGNDENWSPVYDITATYRDENEDTANIPQGFQVSRKADEDTVLEGLVIKNGVTEDRYVWIQVPKNVFKTATSEIDYEGIEKDLKEYTVDYVQDDYEDSYYEECGIGEEEYNQLKNKMLSSIYNNKGFWISQYEVGTNQQRTNVTTTTTSLSSKEGEYPYNYVTIDQSQDIAEEIIKEQNCTGSLMFGVQWDLVLKFIETTKAKTKDKIITDSTSWGNYKNSSFNITKGKYGTTLWVDVNGTFSKSGSDMVMLSTGATERNSVLNIYDLAGNMEEWTLERNINNDDKPPYVTRGGSYMDDVVDDINNSYVSKRNVPTVSSESYIGFRIAIY